MDDVICNKFANLNNEDFKDKIVCCNCGNSEILSKNTKYCPCCGTPLAIIGLPKSAQVDIKDYTGKIDGEARLTAKIYNAGYVPLNISFDTDSLPDIVRIEPEKVVLDADFPGVLHLSKEDGNFSKIYKNIDEYLPSQEFIITLSNNALKIAEKEGLVIPIDTNAVISNQINLDKNKRPYLFIALPYNSNQGEQPSEIIDIHDLDYNITKYDKNSIPQTDVFKLRYENKDTYPVELQIAAIEPQGIIPEFKYICHGYQNGYIPIKIPFNSFLNDEQMDIKLSITPKYNKKEKPDSPITKTIKIHNCCPTMFLVNKDKEIEFENLLVSQQISYAKLDVDIRNNNEDFKITDIEFSNDYVRILNYKELKNRIVKKTDKKIEVKLVFSTRWVNPDKYYFFEGKNNKLSGRIILHTDLLSNLNINIDWKVKIQGLPAKRDNDILALDFGTVNSCIAIYDSKKNNVEIVDINRDAIGSNMGIVPSALAFFDKDTFIVGQKAQEELIHNPDNVVVSIKRCITGEKRKFFREEYSPVKIASLMMEQMILKAVARLGRYPKHVVLTIPANFWGPLRERIKEAFEEAWGECKPDLIDEPTAAAINYMISPDAKSKFDNKESNILVFDFGGGTLDVSILNINKINPDKTIIQPLIARGDNELGGIDLDFALIQYIISKKFDKDSFEYNVLYNNKRIFEEYMRDYSKLAGKVRQARATLSIRSREIKEKLSEEDKVEGIFESFNENGDEKELKLEITRDNFEEAISNRMQRAKKFVLNCIKAAKLKEKDINYLLLTGQSSKVPAVKKILKGILPSPTEFIDNHEIKTCVAKGAAWTSYYRRLATSFKINSLEKTSYRYGYISSRIPDFVFNELIDNGIPFKDAIGEADIDDGIKSLEIVQHEGSKEDDVFRDRKEAGISSIGIADISNIESQNGKYHIKVWFDLDSAKIMLEVNNKPVVIDYKESGESNIYI